LEKKKRAFLPSVSKLSPLVGLYYFVRVSTALVRAPHTKVTPLIANGRIAKKATRWRGFFQQKQPVTGQEFLLDIVVSPF
jgi:hypothetical protein